MEHKVKIQHLTMRIKLTLAITITGLLLNGLSAVPLRTELSILLTNPDTLPPFLHSWWSYVSTGVYETSEKYNFMRYGFDWLAFAHLLIAIAFIGPWRDPVKNQWVVEWGMIAAFLSMVIALGWEHIRGIPIWWSMIDATIALAALLILWICNGSINELKKIIAQG